MIPNPCCYMYYQPLQSCSCDILQVPMQTAATPDNPSEVPLPDQASDVQLHADVPAIPAMPVDGREAAEMQLQIRSAGVLLPHHLTLR